MFVEYLPLLRIEPAYGIPWVSVSLLGDSHRCLSFSPDDLLLVLNFVDDRLSLSASPPQLHFGCLQRRIAVTHPVHPQQISEAGRDDRSRLLVILVRSVTLVPVDPKIPTGGTYNWVVVWTTLVLDLGTTSKQNLFVLANISAMARVARCDTKVAECYAVIGLVVRFLDRSCSRVLRCHFNLRDRYWGLFTMLLFLVQSLFLVFYIVWTVRQPGQGRLAI